MNFEQYSKTFKDEASNAGYSEQNIKRCLNYAEVIFLNNVPVIFNTSHLSSLVGYKKSYIKRAVFRTPYFYRNFSVPKKNGKKRLISEPLPSLKDIQIWILENILNQVKVSPFAKAYRPKVSLIENLKFHKNQKTVFNIDVKDFFPSINTESVQTIFKKFGYSDLISNLLAKLCTKDGSLPQGAPTSPYLSNIYMIRCDELISKYCIDRKIRYTRYADDMSFSGDFDVPALFMHVENVLNGVGLTVNSKKTQLMSQDQRQIVTGIVVNDKPQVDFNKRNRLRQTMYYIKKFGLKEHMKFKKITKSGYLEHLLGKVNFVLQINPSDKEFIDYKDYLWKLINEEKNLTANKH